MDQDNTTRSDQASGSQAPEGNPQNNANTNNEQKTQREEFRVNGDQLLKRVKELINEGNIRRVIIKNEEGKTLIEVPLTLGVVGIALLPVWAAIGAIAALVANCTIVVEKRV